MMKLIESIDLLTDEALLEILDNARWAPSGDNCQPWKVCSSNVRNALDICWDAEQQVAFLDFQRQASRLAVGAFAESIALAASLHSVAAKITSVLSSEPIWARVEFSESPHSAPALLANFLKSRCSNRRPYRTEPLSHSAAKALQDSIEDISNVRLSLFDQPKDIEAIGSAIALAEHVRMQQRQCHEEFHEKIRWTEEEAKKRGTGFYVRTFEIKKHEELALKLTRSYSALRLLDNLIGMSAMASRVAKKQVMASSAIGMVSIEYENDENHLNAGRALQRIWLAATEQGLAFQVLAVASLFIRRVAANGGGFTDQQLTKVAKAKAILEGIPSAPMPQDVVLMFRVGFAQEPSARTCRLTANLLVQENKFERKGLHGTSTASSL